MGERGTHPQAGGNSGCYSFSVLSLFPLLSCLDAFPSRPAHAETPGSSCRYLLPHLPLALSFSPLVNLNPLSYYFSSFSRYVCPLALLPSTPIFLSTTCVALFICDFSNLCKCTSSVCSLLSVCALSEFVLEILLETFCSRGKRAINLILFHPTPLCTFSLCAFSRVGGFTPGNLPLIQCSRYTYNIRRLFSRFHANPLPAAFVHVTCRRYNNEVDNITRLTCLEFAPADSRFVFLSLSLSSSTYNS